MKLNPEILEKTRKELGLSKAKAADLLNMSAMGYGRYENGQRSPSFHTVCFIAQKFGTSPEYLCGESCESTSDAILLTKSDDSELYELVKSFYNDKDLARRLLAYYKTISEHHSAES